MEQTNLTPAPETKLGATGERLKVLTNEVLVEIDKSWDEKTMQVIAANGEKFLEDANAVSITNQAEYEAANDLFLSGAGYLKKGSGFIDPFVQTMHKPWKSACDIRNLFAKPVEAGKKIIEQKLVAWRMAEKRRIEAEQRKLDAERKAKEEKERKEAEAKEREAREKANKAKREADAKAAELKAQAEAAEKEEREAKAREAKLKAEAEAAEAAGNQEEAKEAERKAKAEADEAKRKQEEAAKLANQAQKATDRGVVAETKNLAKAEEHAAAAESVYTPPSVLSHTVKKTETSAKGSVPSIKTWKVTIRNELELVKAVAKGIEEGGLPITCLNLDLQRVEAGIRRWAEVNQITKYDRNGIEVEEWETLQARASTKGKKEKKS
jgi:chemotaxis protein histidine kinase CheA